MRRTSRAVQVLDQLAAEAWGPRSITAVLRPAAAEATARCKARVVFQEPPFWLTMAMLFHERIVTRVQACTCAQVQSCTSSRFVSKRSGSIDMRIRGILPVKGKERRNLRRVSLQRCQPPGVGNESAD